MPSLCNLQFTRQYKFQASTKRSLPGPPQTVHQPSHLVHFALNIWKLGSIYCSEIVLTNFPFHFVEKQILLRRGSTGILDSSEASSALWRLAVAVDILRVSRRLAPLAFAAASGYVKALIFKVPQFGGRFASFGTTEPPSSAVTLWHSCRGERGGDRGTTVVKALCYKSEGRWFNTSWCQWTFFDIKSFRCGGTVVKVLCYKSESCYK